MLSFSQVHTPSIHALVYGDFFPHHPSRCLERLTPWYKCCLSSPNSLLMTESGCVPIIFAMESQREALTQKVLMSVNSGISASSHKGNRSKMTCKKPRIYLSVLSSWPMGCSEESELKLLVLYTDLHEFTCNVCGYLQRLEGGISCPRPGVTSRCELLDTSAGNQTQVLRKSSKCFGLLCHLSRSDIMP